MGTVSKESVTQTPLYDFAEQLLKTGFGPYDYAK